MPHPDPTRFCSPCGILFFTPRALKQHRVQVHGEEPPCRSRPREQWCDHNPTNPGSPLGGFMGHTCIGGL